VDEKLAETRPMRSKEEAQEVSLFPEPDLRSAGSDH